MIGVEKQDEVCCSDDSQFRLLIARAHFEVILRVSGEIIAGGLVEIQTRYSVLRPRLHRCLSVTSRMLPKCNNCWKTQKQEGERCTSCSSSNCHQISCQL